jgi:glutathione peroxidase
MIVNVASKCGLTPQYEQLQAIYTQYQERGLVILGFPANDFMGQEPGSADEIQAFCQRNYGVSFPMFAKISVKGKDMHPLFQYLVQETGDKPSWNFQKYLVNRQGKPVAAFDPSTRPDDQQIIARIEQLLAEQ